MNNTIILKKAVNTLLWIYKRITNKFTNLYSKLKKWFPILEKYPPLKYSIIPLLVGLFILIRYIIKFVINEFATLTSDFIEEISGCNITEKEIAISIAVVLISIKISFVLKSIKNKNKLDLNDESTK